MFFILLGNSKGSYFGVYNDWLGEMGKFKFFSFVLSFRVDRIVIEFGLLGIGYILHIKNKK